MDAERLIPPEFYDDSWEDEGECVSCWEPISIKATYGLLVGELFVHLCDRCNTELDLEGMNDKAKAAFIIDHNNVIK